MMKKLYFFFLLLSFWGLGGFSYAQSVKLIGTDFANSAITFTVNLNSATSTWVFVEYTTDPSPTSAIMSRATFTDVSYTPPSTGTLAAEGRGFLLESSATITAKLDGVSGKFSLCVYAVDVPPNAVSQPDGTYLLYGTPPFTINGDITEHSNTFGPGTCITSITDFTYNPEGRIIAPPFSAGAINDAGVFTLNGHAPATNPTNATEASGGVGNIMYEWRRTGTNSKTLTNSNFPEYDISDDPTNYDTPGAYYFTRYAKDGICNTTFTPSGGQYELWVDVPPGAGTQTWVCNAQTWSGALSYSVAGCTDSPSFAGSNPPTVARYRSTNLYPNSGYLYNWKCVDEQGAVLCPSPWRVPMMSDFETLDACFKNMTEYGSVGSRDWMAATYENLWGVVYGGYSNAIDLVTHGTWSYYWTPESLSSTQAKRPGLNYNGARQLGTSAGAKLGGFQVRCVL
jgi:uncharacterized protein (TIGR02145 family)